MSRRFPSLSSDGTATPPSELDEALKKALGEHSSDFEYKDENGAPIGPFGVFAYTPDLFPSYLTFASTILNQKVLSSTERELIILAVTATNRVPYMLYAHSRIALKLGMTEEQVTSASKGIEPAGLTDEDKVIYATALELAKTGAPLTEDTWQRAEAALGKARCARIAHVVGLYMYTGGLLRLGAIPAPEN